jgi:hypothetical protein
MVIVFDETLVWIIWKVQRIKSEIEKQTEKSIKIILSN